MTAKEKISEFRLHLFSGEAEATNENTVQADTFREKVS